MRIFLRGLLMALGCALACGGCAASSSQVKGYSNQKEIHVAPAGRAGNAGIEELKQRRRPK